MRDPHLFGALVTQLRLWRHEAMNWDLPFGRRDGVWRWRKRVPARVLAFPAIDPADDRSDEESRAA